MYLPRKCTSAAASKTTERKKKEEAGGEKLSILNFWTNWSREESTWRSKLLQLKVRWGFGREEDAKNPTIKAGSCVS